MRKKERHRLLTRLLTENDIQKQEEFVDYHIDVAITEPEVFQHQLSDWLIWYNTKRPHYSLNLKSPMQYLLDLLQLPVQESNMLWTDTTT